jgi:glycosyltransferase involved in cell wall biosynthesis
MNHKVSILIPVYNREKYIREAVVSALNQTYKNIEVVIVDNKSTDDTWNILKNLAKGDQRIKIFQNGINIGPVKNWKRCIDEATGKYGKILWSDDLIASEFLEKTIPFLEEDNDIGFVYTGTEFFSDGTLPKTDTYFIGDTGVHNSDQYINGVLFGGNYPVSPGCALFRLSDLKKNLIVDIPNKVGSDFSMHAIGSDLLILLLTAHQSSKFAFVNEKLSLFRVHEESITIKSSYGKVPLYYDIAKAYFIENFREDLIPKFNYNLQLDIKYYPAKEYNINSLEDFYMKNKNLKVAWSWIAVNIIRRCWLRTKNVVELLTCK